VCTTGGEGGFCTPSGSTTATTGTIDSPIGRRR
jgi:hypothetical protein